MQIPKMARKRKRLSEQVVVVTGASSGIGLATARAAASRGARVVLVARDADELRNVTNDIRARGGRAVYVAADVTEAEAVERVAEVAAAEYGGIDTWINNAGIGLYGKLTEIPMEDKRRMFEINFWGVVNGCRTAVRHLRRGGGTIINIGSVASDRAVPLLSIYSASKQAVQGYTDGLRMELEHEGLPIAVTLVKPGSTNTPFVDHARNYMDQAPYYAPPVYDASVVAEAILKCAERPVREVTIGGGSRMMAMAGKIAPRTTDRYMEMAMFRLQQDPERPADGRDGLDTSSGEGREEGPYRGRVRQSSAYTTAVLSDVMRAMPFVAAAAVFAAAARRWRTDG